MKKVKYKDLEVGMIVNGRGLITALPNNVGENEWSVMTFESDTCWAAYISHDDPYWGQCASVIVDNEDEEVEVFENRLEEKQLLEQMRQAVQERIQDGYRDVELLNKEIGWRAIATDLQYETELDLSDLLNDEFDDGNGDNIEGA